MQNYFTPDIETASRDYLTAIQSARLIKMVENGLMRKEGASRCTIYVKNTEGR